MARNAEDFLGFTCGGAFYRRSHAMGRTVVMVRTFATPQTAALFLAESVGRSPGLSARFRAPVGAEEVPLLDGDASPLPAAVEVAWLLLSSSEQALLRLFGVERPGEPR